jgi:16S rRNA (uracil1498-N3)-methyltransferase
VTPDGIEHRCKVTAANHRQVEAEVVASSPSRREPAVRIRLCLALLKGDQFDRIIEYAAEIGVDSVQPVSTERAVARLGPDRAGSRMQRWRQIMRQGAELGQRGRVPELLPLVTVDKAITRAADAGLASFLLYEGPGIRSLSSAEFDPLTGACVLVGPEGGWSESEVRLAQQAGGTPVTLGPRIMRPLPAALAAVAILLHRAGELELKEE